MLTVFQLRMIFTTLVMYLLYIALWINLVFCFQEEEPSNEETNGILYNYTKNLVNKIKSNYQATPFRKHGIWLGQIYTRPESSTVPPITPTSATPNHQTTKLVPNSLQNDDHLQPPSIHHLHHHLIRLLNISKHHEGSLFKVRGSGTKRRNRFRKTARIKNLANNPKVHRKRGLKLARKLIPIVGVHVGDGLSSEFDLSMENKRVEDKEKISKSRKAVILNVNGGNLRMENYDEEDWARRQYVNRKTEEKKFALLEHDDDSNVTIRLKRGFMQPVFNILRQRRFKIKQENTEVEKENLGRGKYLRNLHPLVRRRFKKRYIFI